MPSTRDVIVGLGSNLGGRASLLRAGRALLGARLGVEGRAAPVWRTPPVGPPQPEYLNTAVAFATDAPLDTVLAHCLAVEAALGRARRERWGARTLDADVLWHDGPPTHTPTLDVPHPELTRRAFALAPLLALAPDARAEDGAPLAASLGSAPGPQVLDALDGGFTTETVSHTADEGFRVRAMDRADLLAAAAEALGAIVVDPATVAAEEVRALEVPCDGDDEARMIAWLSEVLYAMDGDRFAIRRVAVLDDGEERVVARLIGAALDESRHGVRTAVKAVTWHGLEVAQDPEGWRAQVIVDL